MRVITRRINSTRGTVRPQKRMPPPPPQWHSMWRKDHRPGYPAILYIYFCLFVRFLFFYLCCKFSQIVDEMGFVSFVVEKLDNNVFSSVNSLCGAGS